MQPRINASRAVSATGQASADAADEVDGAEEDEDPEKGQNEYFDAAAAPALTLLAAAGSAIDRWRCSLISVSTQSSRARIDSATAIGIESKHAKMYMSSSPSSTGCPKPLNRSLA